MRKSDKPSTTDIQMRITQRITLNKSFSMLSILLIVKGKISNKYSAWCAKFREPVKINAAQMK